MTNVTPFLMFEGRAREAMEFYVSLLPDSRIVEMNLYGPGQAGAEGSVHTARFTLAGQEFMCIDSPAKHAFSFTPTTSIFVDCDSEAELDALYAALVAGGAALMPLGAYGFSRKFGWIADRFGVSWQLNLPA